jgi:predicted enzyme related to lactoylglutathione lyase
MDIPRKGFVWHELMTTDVERSVKFYREVTGLNTIPGQYNLMMEGGQPVGGIVGPREGESGWPSGGPEPHWIAYIGVDDVDAAAEKTREFGGEVLLPPISMPDIGKAAVLRDPQGAVFGVFSLVKNNSLK